MAIFDRRLCRICMINSELVSIVEDNVKNEGEASILQKFITLNLNIKRNDGLPQDICVNCITQLNTSFIFIETSKKSDEIFRNQFLSNFIGTTALDQDVKTILTPAQVYLLQPNDVKNDDQAPHVKEEDIESDASMQPDELDSWTNNPNENEGKLFVCKFCKKVFAEANLMNSHVQNIHLKTGDDFHLDQSIIVKSVKTTSCKSHVLKNHKHDEELKIQSNENYCKICNKGFRSKLILRRHTAYHTQKIETKPEVANSHSSKGFICAHCHNKFTTKRSMKNHILYFHMDPTSRLETPKKPKYVCNICDMEFAKKKLLERHLKVHLKKKEVVKRRNKPKLCTICNKWFSNCYTFKRHLHTDHAIERNYFLCPLCGKRFLENSCLKSHLECHKPERKIFHCALCTKTFQTSSGLYYHTKTNHEAKKPYACDYEGCSAKYLTPSLLKKHTMGHTGEKPFQCNFCPVRFRANKHRENHHRTHTGEKPFKCTHENCDRAFAQKYDLTKHQTVHTGEKRHVCHCGETFRLASILKTHLKSHQT